MTINRRRFLQQLIQSASLISINSHINISAANTIPADSLTALPRFLDTLLPEDVSPSATQLGIDKDLLQHAQTVDNYPQLLQIGCQWLDQHAMSLYGK
ncbi:hypothetical protein, partial [Methylophaga sp.]|uniref:hypothetical protein n=1 Tax=Methylophaga sp. TaxID=2024840 RepID=UPI003F696D0A